MQITGMELAKRTGLSYQTIINATNRGQLTKVESPDGRVRFDESTVLAEIEAAGIKPRKKKADADPEEAQVAQDEQSLQALDNEEEPLPASESSNEIEKTEATPIAEVLATAFRKAKSAFKKEVMAHAKIAEEAGDSATELALLRIHVHSGEAFSAIQDEILGTEEGNA